MDYKDLFEKECEIAAGYHREIVLLRTYVKESITELEKIKAGYAGMFGCQTETYEAEALRLAPEWNDQVIAKLKRALQR
jgi:hypothetical protein